VQNTIAATRAHLYPHARLYSSAEKLGIDTWKYGNGAQSIGKEIHAYPASK
jgi:hypothetical protein